MSKWVEKFKNKKVFALYLLGVLLLSSSVSFAYFTSRTNANGSGGIVTGTTTEVFEEGLVADGNINFNNTDMYPGHTAIASIKVTGKGSNAPALYDVVFTGNNTFITPLNYTVYKTTTNIDASYSCEVKIEKRGIQKIYYEECTGTNIEQLGEAVSTGTINTGNSTTILKSDELMITSEAGTEAYYYIVIEYPNEESDQNEDMGSVIEGNITIDKKEYQAPSIMMTSSTTSGSNGWVQSASITTSITAYSSNNEVLCCTTTSDNCTPNTSAILTDNSFSVTLNSNASPQKVCVRVTDEYNQVGEGCSEAFSVDTVNPTISITNTSSTSNSIVVTVSGSDSHSGIYQYRFSNNGGSSYTTITSSNSTYTYTFNNLSSGTSYNIAVQSVDRSGRVSNTVTRSVSTTSSARDVILAGKAISTRSNFRNRLTVNTTGTIYSAEDDDGTTYYFAGDTDENWVSFAGHYWRIIRINGDGTIRMIYSGTGSAQRTGTGTRIGVSAFNNTVASDRAYIGFKYTVGSLRGTGTNSTILTALNAWYSNNISTDNRKYIDINAGFCGDRTPSSSDSSIDNSIGTTTTYYIGYIKYYGNTLMVPTYNCEDSRDLYTVSNSSRGNRSLTYPVGLITMDEVWYAGGHQSNNSSYFLYTGQYYWTISPSIFNGGYAYVFYVSSNGMLGAGVSSGAVYWGEPGVRPVINLRADVTLTGDGTLSNPYQVVGAS